MRRFWWVVVVAAGLVAGCVSENRSQVRIPPDQTQAAHEIIEDHAAAICPEARTFEVRCYRRVDDSTICAVRCQD